MRNLTALTARFLVRKVGHPCLRAQLRGSRDLFPRDLSIYVQKNVI